MHLPKTALAIAAAALVAAVGCGSGDPARTAAPDTPTRQAGPPLAGTDWRLISFRAPGEDPVAVTPPRDWTLRLDGRGHFSARACNGFGGDAVVDGARLTLTRRGVSTLIGCVPDVEGQFDDTTEGPVAWAIEGHTLTLTSPDGHQLTYRAGLA